MNLGYFSKSDISNFTAGMGIPSISVDHYVNPIDGVYGDEEATLDVQYGVFPPPPPPLSHFANVIVGRSCH